MEVYTTHLRIELDSKYSWVSVETTSQPTSTEDRSGAAAASVEEVKNSPRRGGRYDGERKCKKSELHDRRISNFGWGCLFFDVGDEFTS